MRKGFTLIELLLYIGLTAIILTAGLSLAWTVLFDQTKTTALTEIDYNYQFLDSFLRTQIQEAKAVNFTQSILEVNPSRLVLTNADDSTTTIETENKTIILNGQNFVLTDLKITLPNEAPLSLITNKTDIATFIVKYSAANKQIMTDISINYLNPSQSTRYEAHKTWKNTTTIKSQ